MKKYLVTWNMGFVEYEVEAKDKDEAIEIALKKRLDDNIQSPTSELDSVEEIK